MKTLKILYLTSNKNLQIIKQLQKEQSSVFRFSYNRLEKSYSTKEIYHLVKNMKHIDNLPAQSINHVIQEARQQLEAEKSLGIKKSIFGGKVNFFKRLQGKITNEEWKELRLRPFISIGDTSHKGNQFFTFNIIEDNRILFKPNRKTKIYLNLPKIHKNYKNELFRIQELMENKEQPITIKLDQKFIYISYEDITEKPIFATSGNYIGIDLNPDFIACSLFNQNKQLLQSWTYKLTNLTQDTPLPEDFDELTDEPIRNSKDWFIKRQNKILHESYEIAKNIVNKCKHFNVKFIFIEDLSTIKNDNKGNNISNRKINNSWPRNKFIDNLTKRSSLSRIALFKVNPAYSSFIGNLVNQFPDPISASMEIARRGYSCIIEKTKQFYPILDMNQLTGQWKDLLAFNVKCSSWNELFSLIKNSELRYRVPFLEEYGFRKLFSNKSRMLICNKDYTFV